MSPDEAALKAGIAANPYSLTERLVYADWLDEVNEPQKAITLRLAAGLITPEGCNGLNRDQCREELDKLFGPAVTWDSSEPGIFIPNYAIYVGDDGLPRLAIQKSVYEKHCAHIDNVWPWPHDECAGANYTTVPPAPQEFEPAHRNIPVMALKIAIMARSANAIGINLMDIDAVTAAGGRPGLYCAIVNHPHTEIARLFMEYGADVSFKFTQGSGINNYLVSAAVGDLYTIADRLIEHNIDIEKGRTNLSGRHNETPLSITILYHGSNVAVSLVHNNAAVTQENFIHAIKYDMKNVVKAILERGISPNFSISERTGIKAATWPLLTARAHNKLEIFGMLLEHQADPNFHFPGKPAVLGFCMHRSFDKTTREMAKLLLNHPKINLGHTFKTEPMTACNYLFLAVVHGNKELAEMILDKKPELIDFIEPTTGWSVMHAAIQGGGDIAMLKMLHKRKAKINILARNDSTPLDMVLSMSDAGDNHQAAAFLRSKGGRTSGVITRDD